MKENEKIDVSFAGSSNEVPEKEVEVQKEEVRKHMRDGKESVIVVEETPELASSSKVVAVEESEETHDPYSGAIEAFFAGYQTFQEGMKALQRFTQPKLVFGKLMGVLNAFQAVIVDFKEAEFTVPAEFQEGHDFILEGIEKYDRFLVEYPVVLQGKGGLKAMKKVTSLGKLSAQADQDMKKAFRSFDEATQGV